jgi:hypothetical protein
MKFDPVTSMRILHGGRVVLGHNSGMITLNRVSHTITDDSKPPRA